ncbi:MAG TPA: PCRF domain-containing protein, partial [Pirellulales bacterium]
MRDKLEAQLDRFLEIERLVQDPDVLSDGARYSALAKERGSLAKVAMKYREFKELNEQIAETRRMAEEEADAEMREMALEELPGLNERREQSWNELLDLTSGGEEANRTRCMLEIRGGTGGDEAALFARDLYEMYMKYAIRYGWKTEILDASPTELGGFKEIIVGLEGEGCFRQMQYESGGHRVQRVPETETKGRIQTSMATVAVLPEPEDVEIELKPD